MRKTVSIISDPASSRRQGCLKNTSLFCTDDHKERRKKIFSLLKKIEGVSLSNIEERQCSKVSEEDRLVILRNISENLCVIAIYVAGSNVRLEMNCNSFDLKTFKRVHIKRIRKLENLEKRCR